MPPRRQPPKRQRPEPAPIRRSPAIERLCRAIEGTRDERARRSLADAFWQGTAARTPLLEAGDDGERVVTFLWRSSGDAEVLLFVNRLTDETDLGRSELARVPGTDVWHLSYALEPDWRGSYGFVVHDGDGPAPWRGTDDQVSLRGLLDRARSDPRNPLTCPNRAGTTLSVAELPDAPPQPWRDAEAAAPATGRCARPPAPTAGSAGCTSPGPGPARPTPAPTHPSGSSSTARSGWSASASIAHWTP